MITAVMSLTTMHVFLAKISSFTHYKTYDYGYLLKYVPKVTHLAFSLELIICIEYTFVH